MVLTFADIESLVLTQAKETPALEFKDGEALSRGGTQERELVKDVTAMANAAGGRIIYGIAEATSASGESIAGSLAPVVDPATTDDWIHQLIAANTSPPFSDFRVTSIMCPAGRIVVIDIEMAATAHQSTKTYIYYQRTGASAKPMLDFQIRDVMGRRNRPRIAVQLVPSVLSATGDRNEISLRASLFNEGNLSIDRWQLRIGVPVEAIDHVAMGQQSHGPRRAEDRTERLRDYLCVDYASSMMHFHQHRMNDLHPGNWLDLDGNIGLGVIRLAMPTSVLRTLQGTRPPIRWTLFMADTQPEEGEVPFESWCIFPP
jgi:hypothetical protein